MNWYAAKLLADEFAADRQRTAGPHRRVRGTPVVGSARRTVQGVGRCTCPPAGSGERLRTHKTLSGVIGDDRRAVLDAVREGGQTCRLIPTPGS